MTATDRNGVDVLIAQQMLAEESLAALRHVLSELRDINARLGYAAESGGEERLPSVTIEDMAKGPPKITSKSYDGRPLTRALVDQHIDAHGYAHRLAEARALDGWAVTLEEAQRIDAELRAAVGAKPREAS